VSLRPASPKRFWRLRRPDRPPSRRSSSTTSSPARSPATARASPTPPQALQRLVSRDLDRQPQRTERSQPAMKPCAATGASRRGRCVGDGHGRRLRQQVAEDDLQEKNHEINVTPFIDVMLVLLIIFMVACTTGNSRRQCRPAGIDGQRPRRAPEEPLLRHAEGRPQHLDRQGHGCPHRLPAAARRCRQGRQGKPHLPARRPWRRLWRADGGDEPDAAAQAILKIALVGLEQVQATPPATNGGQPQ